MEHTSFPSCAPVPLSQLPEQGKERFSSSLYVNLKGGLLCLLRLSSALKRSVGTRGKGSVAKTSGGCLASNVSAPHSYIPELKEFFFF